MKSILILAILGICQIGLGAERYKEGSLIWSNGLCKVVNANGNLELYSTTFSDAINSCKDLDDYGPAEEAYLNILDNALPELVVRLAQIEDEKIQKEIRARKDEYGSLGLLGMAAEAQRLILSQGRSSETASGPSMLDYVASLIETSGLSSKLKSDVLQQAGPFSQLIRLGEHLIDADYSTSTLDQ